MNPDIFVDIFELIFIILGGVLLMLIIYLGVRDQYKSQYEIAERNRKLEQYYDNVKIGDIFIYKYNNVKFKVTRKAFNMIELTELVDLKIPIKHYVNIEDLMANYIFEYIGQSNNG